MICEWNPKANRLNMTSDHNHRVLAVHALATCEDKLNLCKSCAKLPRFKRWTYVEPLKEAAQ